MPTPRNIFIGLLASLWLILAGCTHNDGDIGPLFGSWSLRAIDIDGKPDPDFVEDATFFAFQSDVIEVSFIDMHHNKRVRRGTWLRDDDMLILDFSHHDDKYPPSTNTYAPPEWIHITKPITRMKILRLSGKEMVLSTDSYTYSLRKTW